MLLQVGTWERTLYLGILAYGTALPAAAALPLSLLARRSAASAARSRRTVFKSVVGRLPPPCWALALASAFCCAPRTGRPIACRGSAELVVETAGDGVTAEAPTSASLAAMRASAAAAMTSRLLPRELGTADACGLETARPDCSDNCALALRPPAPASALECGAVAFWRADGSAQSIHFNGTSVAGNVCILPNLWPLPRMPLCWLSCCI